MLKSHFKEDKTIKQGFSAKKCLEKISGEMRVAYGSIGTIKLNPPPPGAFWVLHG